ncbi:hypothetical protein K431DRAFT_309775 [Polychaeton citri CBS 116435]|uniref:Heterokaryon incompatibility domain-containing protein n=1 Tax=Polychaeton citri CBS 116435 TaxID=1314669 RepID=A0A9P4UTD9_9PEZI|nr:hypothetical protein K431DRAFT_309775 [Polychaeton citri CBS 116435]
MELDTDKELGAIVGSLDSLIEKTLEIQECVVVRANFSHWAKHLRFIEVPGVSSTEPEDICIRTRTLNLTSKDDHPAETNYLAVSYCWNSFESSDGTQSCSSYTIRTASGVRTSRVPTSILERSISCAIRRGIRLVWIDQECIDQDDPLDLEQGIQCMDQVYRSAAYSIGLLSVRKDLRSSFRTFTRILSHARNRSIRHDNSWLSSWYDNADPQSLSEMIRLLSDILADRWFSRNWTYQEASCTQGQMELQIPHGFNNNPWFTGGCPDEISLRLSELFDVVSMVRNAANTTPQLSSGIGNSNMEVMGGFYVQVWEQERRASRPQSFEVANQMKLRDNSVVSDRLAIAANLCEYQKRIDPIDLSRKRYSYSVCAFAQALINGTIITSGRSNIFASTGVPIFRWQDEKIYDLLTSPRYLSTSLAHRERVEPRFADVRVRKEGLETSGWLWSVDEKVELHKVREKYQELPEKLKEANNLETLLLLVNAVLVDLLVELEEIGLPRIAETIRACIRVRSPGTVLSSEHVQEEPITDHYHVGHWFFNLMKTLLERGYIWCGRLDGEEDLSSIFHCDGAVTVFTSSAVAFRDMPRPWMGQNFVSCGVIPGLVVDGVVELVHTMEPIHGIWHSAEDDRRRYMFRWGEQ